MSACLYTCAYVSVPLWLKFTDYQHTLAHMHTLMHAHTCTHPALNKHTLPHHRKMTGTGGGSWTPPTLPPPENNTVPGQTVQTAGGPGSTPTAWASSNEPSCLHRPSCSKGHERDDSWRQWVIPAHRKQLLHPNLEPFLERFLPSLSLVLLIKHPGLGIPIPVFYGFDKGASSFTHNGDSLFI